MKLPDTPVGRQLDWIVGHVGTGATDDGYASRFTAGFLGSVPIAHVTAFFRDNAWIAESTADIAHADDHHLVVTLSADGEPRIVIDLHVEADEPHLIDGLLLKPPGPTLKQIVEQAEPLSGPLADAVAERFAPFAMSLKAGGVAVGVTRGGGRETFTFGDADPELSYQIGSSTKTFTGTLLAEMVSRGEVAYDDPVTKYLPSGVQVPSSGERQITLIDLATHSSGLPRLAPNMEKGQDEQNPYVHLTPERMYDELSKTTLEHPVGSQVLYSNYGMAVLGHALGLAAGRSYADLIRERITQPLGMTRTQMHPAEGIAQGYEDGSPVPRWSGETSQAAGIGLESTIDDLLIYAEANIDPSSTSLAGPVTDAQTVRLPHNDDADQALGWLWIKVGDDRWLFHNGGTAGFTTSIVIHPPSKTAVVVLCNGGGGLGLDPCAYGLLATLTKGRA